jgi:hypothetical protein
VYFTGSGARTDGWSAVSGALESIKVTPWPGNAGGSSLAPPTESPKMPRDVGKGNGGAPPSSSAPPAADTPAIADAPTAAPATEGFASEAPGSAEAIANAEAPAEENVLSVSAQSEA